MTTKKLLELDSAEIQKIFTELQNKISLLEEENKRLKERLRDLEESRERIKQELAIAKKSRPSQK